jgi:hypothetical protein
MSVGGKNKHTIVTFKRSMLNLENIKQEYDP